MPEEMSTTSTTNAKKGRSFGRRINLFKRKKLHQPLSELDSASAGPNDDYDIYDDDDDENDVHLPDGGSASNGFSNGNSTCSSVYSASLSLSMGSEKENESRSSALTRRSNRKGTTKARTSPSEVMPLRKIAMMDSQTATFSSNSNTDSTHVRKESLESNGSQFSDTNLDDIKPFHSTGRNHFNHSNWNNLTHKKEEGEKGHQEQKQEQQQEESENNMNKKQRPPKNKKKGFLNQIKSKIDSKGSSSAIVPSNSIDTSIEDKKKFQISETPKFTNKSINVSNPISSLGKNDSSNGDGDKMILTRSALSRPFGRTSLPSHLAKQWCVQVSPDYDSSINCWKYHILVQKDEYLTSGSSFLSPSRNSHYHSSSSKDKTESLGSPQSVIQDGTQNQSSPMRNEVTLSKSFNAANVERTLKDIVWLERALRDEFHGALIFPSLSMTLTSGTDWTTAVKLDKETFEKGEWDPVTLSHELLNAVLEEEDYDMGSETDDDGTRRPPFDPKLLSDWLNDILNGVRGKGELILNYSASRMVDIMHSESMESFFYKVNEPLVDLHFMKGRADKNWLPINFDLGSLPLRDNNDFNDDGGNYTLKGLMAFPLICISACSPDKQLLDSDSILSRRDMNRTKQQSPDFWQNSMLSDELKAQSYYIGLQRENTLRAMYRLRILLEKEALVSAAWKRFAISLSNLFTAGKDIESCKVGGSKGKDQSSKVSKDRVDDSLRVLARHKVERATPSLKVLSGMLSAYYADFSSVNQSLSAFADGVKKLETEKAALGASGDENWKQALKAVSPLTLFQDTDGIKDAHVLKMEMRVFEQRQSFNESLMKSSLLQLCNSIDLRVFRMSWKFFKMECGQASLLSNAAKKVQNSIGEEVQDGSIFEGTPNDHEIDIVKRLLDLGSKRKYKYYPYPKSSSSSHTGSESDLISENDSAFVEEDENASINSPLFDKAMELVKERNGCWDTDLALTILQACGIQNPEILIEDSTREVRTVQRLTESLRAQVNRCEEAISMLKDVAFEFGTGRVLEHRRRFLSDLAVVFSGALYSKNNNHHRNTSHEKVLSKIGIDVNDSAGWLSLVDDEDCSYIKSEGSCGNIASNYQEVREIGTFELIEQMSEMLTDQRKRIEKMESFVYMNCVGGQIEKHFSKVRSDALIAWEKKTDITTAINIATKKRLPLLVKELKSKLAALHPVVSHTSVKEAKERHLGSKALKVELESIASSKFEQIKESSTRDAVLAILKWADHEKNVAAKEIKALSEAIKEIERILRCDEKIIETDGGAHLFASSGIS